MAGPSIIVAGVGSRLEGLTWKSESILRIGSHDGMDIVLKDATVSREHAEIQRLGKNWVLRDLADRQQTLLNGTPLGKGDYRLRAHDVIKCGNFALRVASLEVAEIAAAPAHKILNPGNGHVGDPMRDSGTFVRVQAKAQNSWDQALLRISADPSGRPEPGSAIATLLRTGQHLRHIANLDELLHSVLAEVISALGAQRGSIVLANTASNQLELRAAQGGSAQKCYSRTLAERVFKSGESLLCRDVRMDEDLVCARSIRMGTMSSIVCVLLRSPRKSLGVLQLDRNPSQAPFEENDLYLADAIAANVAVGIESAQLVEEQSAQFVQTLTALARTVEMKDSETHDHTQRVTEYALVLADELKLSPIVRDQLEVGTPLHDIGKIAIPDIILGKCAPLNAEEFEKMKQHTIKGAEILQSIRKLTPMIPIVRNHHERWDGGGYPDGLKAEAIPLTARIVAVADAFDAMTSNRPYRRALSCEVAFTELRDKAGSHFDPTCIDAFLHSRPRVEESCARNR